MQNLENKDEVKVHKLTINGGKINWAKLKMSK